MMGITIQQLVGMSLIVISAIICIFVSNYFFKRLFKRHMEADRARFGTISRVVASIVKFLIGFIAVMSVLTVLGYNVKSFLAGLGLVSAIIGLALQDTLKDYLMGLHILFDESMDIGSLVTINGHTGVVKSFTLRTTKLYDIELGGVVYICNRDIVTIEEGFPYISINVPVSDRNKAADVAAAFDSIINELSGIEGVIKAEYLGVSAFIDNGTQHLVRITPDVYKALAIRREANTLIYNSLYEAGISLRQSAIVSC